METNKYEHLEKCHNKIVSILPSVWRKAIIISKDVLGKTNFAGIVTYLINKEYKERFENK